LAPNAAAEQELKWLPTRRNRNGRAPQDAAAETLHASIASWKEKTAEIDVQAHREASKEMLPHCAREMRKEK
jgi:hypothetical protein